MFDLNTNYRIEILDVQQNKLASADVNSSTIKEVDDLFQENSKKIAKFKDLNNKIHSVDMKLAEYFCYSKILNENNKNPGSPKSDNRNIDSNSLINESSLTENLSE